VEIDELVLDGFERIDRDAVAGAFRRELDRLLRRDPGRLALADNDTARARVVADLPETMPSHRLGQSLAGAVFRAIDGVNERTTGPAARTPGPAARAAGPAAAAVSHRDASPAVGQP
jgi:hypothetical protein